MNVRPAFLLLALSALLSSGCVYPLEREGTDGQYNALSLALSLKSPGDVLEGPATKMSAAITQDGLPFRGIEQVYVIPFQTASAAPVGNGSTRKGDRNVIIQNPSIGKTGLVAYNNAHLYNIAILPRYMNRVLAYGKAMDDGSVTTKDGKHKNGVLTPAGLDNPDTPGAISFSLEAVLETEDLKAINQKSDNMIAALNDVVEQLQATNDADIRVFLAAFTAQNEITACSYQSLYRLEQTLLGALSEYSGTDPVAINALMRKISSLQAARNAAGSGFPTSYGIPEGALGMWWNGHRFVKLINGVNISLVPVTGYCYPPSLWYYANSPVRTSADDNVKEQYKPQNETWRSILSYYSEGTIVQSSTRSVAIEYQLEYGVGLVEFHFLAPTGNAESAGGCPLKGIIIGDQKDVDYSFAPKSSESRFIYDNTISGVTLGGTSAGGTSQYVQMLVLPTADDQTVHFALEFQNNTSSAFQCQQGKVQPNSRFYLAGELVPGLGSKPDGESISGVFDSDYKTTIYVRVTDLNKAYNTVPDLRDPQLELGVVAEMDWKQVEPGGSKLSF